MEHYEMNGASSRVRQTLSHGKASEVRQHVQGLPQGVTHIDVLNLLKSVYREMGLSDSEMTHLEYMLIRTQAQDWQEGQRPIFYKTVQRIAEERTLLEREVNRLEHRLHCKGFIGWHDSKSYKRYGRRCEATGKIIHAYGVDLSPMIKKYEEMARVLHEKDRYARYIESLRNEAGWLSRRIGVIRSYIARTEDVDAQIETAALYAAYKEQSKKRSDRLKEEQLHVRIKIQYEVIEQLEKLFHACTNHLYELPIGLRMVPLKRKQEAGNMAIANCGQSVNMTDTSVKNVRHIYNNTNSHSSKEEILCNHAVDNVNKTECALAHNSAPLKIAFGNAGHLPLQEKKSNKGIVRHHINHHSQQINHPPALSFIKKSNYPNGSSGRSVGDIGLDHLTPTMAMQAMSPAFEHHLPVGYDGFGWHEIIQAAEKMLPFLGISEHAWREACGSLGRTGAALCILIADARAEEISSYGGFLRACVRKAEDGKLHLHKSIFGLMKKCGQRMM